MYIPSNRSFKPLLVKASQLKGLLCIPPRNCFRLSTSDQNASYKRVAIYHLLHLVLMP